MFNYILEENVDNELLHIANMPSLAKLKDSYERMAEEDKTNWDAAEKLAWFYAHERTSSTKRWHFNFEKGNQILQERLIISMGNKKLSELNEILMSHETFLVLHYFQNAWNIISNDLINMGIAIDDKIKGYAKYKKRELTYKWIYKNSYAAIPGGQIISDGDLDYRYELPIKESFYFKLDNQSFPNESKELNLKNNDIKVLLFDFNKLSMGIRLVQDILIDEGIHADIIEPSGEFIKKMEQDFHVIAISLSDRHLDEAAKFISDIREINKRIPIIIGGPAVVQYRELFCLLAYEEIYFYIGDAEELLSKLIKLLYAKYVEKQPIDNLLMDMHGLIFRTADSIGIIKPEIPSRTCEFRLFLPKQEKNGLDYDWNPSRGCPNRCAYCNNVQGKFRAASLLSMKSHILAILGHAVGFTSEMLSEIGIIIGEKVESLKEASDLKKMFYPRENIARIKDKYISTWNVSISDIEHYLQEDMNDSLYISKIRLLKTILVLNGISILHTERKSVLKKIINKQRKIFTASDNFLVEDLKIIQFFKWLKNNDLNEYFEFRMQTSINFMWDSRNNRPNEELILHMKNAGVKSIGFGYDSSSNSIGKDVLKRNSYNMMLKLLDSMVRAGFEKENIRIHHFFSSPLSSFESTFEGLLLREANIANDRGNMIAFVLYTYRSELGMISKMNDYNGKEYDFIKSEAMLLPMLDKKTTAYLKKLFKFNTQTQEFEDIYDVNILFASCFKDDIYQILRKWCSPDEKDPEIHALGKLIQLIDSKHKGQKLADIFHNIKEFCKLKNIFSFERILELSPEEFPCEKKLL
ncbi:MAG: hypothetical protein HQK79_02285 [Desulfobacterales bacterium]|nr:hypothetical protein [Desulfobacterales bacterium]MBF0396024.1 hypothetical protein [Desulfobacterales bacterium]